MRDIQHRLVALGYPVGDDESGSYGEGTEAAVRAFQDRRGLRVDGVCGRDTWTSLVEAGWRLGDRPLCQTVPMQRGDDVAELQRRLGSLGFDAGRVDGIFGVNTDRALTDFQRNVGLVADSICGPATLAALARLGATDGARGAGGTASPGSAGAVGGSVSAVRERELHRRRGPSLRDRTVVVGECGGLDALVRAVATALTAAGAEAVVVQHPEESQLAAQANALGADAFVGLSVAGSGSGPGSTCTTAYYRSPAGWESPEGRRLAELVQARVRPVLGAADGGVRGMAVAALRETRMPAVLVDLGAPTLVVERTAEVAAALADGLRRWVDAASEALTDVG